MIKIIKKEIYNNLIEEIADLRKTNITQERYQKQRYDKLMKDYNTYKQDTLVEIDQLKKKNEKEQGKLSKEYEEKISEYQKKLRLANSTIGGYKSNLNRTEEENKAFLKSLKSAEVEIENLNLEKKSMLETISKLEKEVRGLKAKITPPTIEEMKEYDIRKIPRNRRRKANAK